MLPDGVEERARLWLESGKGFRSLRSDKLNSPAFKRDDIAQSTLTTKASRGDRLQAWRLRNYPSIDVDYSTLYAGKMVGDLDEARDKLMSMGYRNNPTAYVEVTDEYGPDDGSYARQFITETQANIDIPKLTGFPDLFKRLKRQVHVTVFKIGEEVHFLSHEEKSAWLQPIQHVTVNNSSARRGVQLFRMSWYEKFGEELGDKGGVEWETIY